MITAAFLFAGVCCAPAATLPLSITDRTLPSVDGWGYCMSGVSWKVQVAKRSFWFKWLKTQQKLLSLKLFFQSFQLFDSTYSVSACFRHVLSPCENTEGGILFSLLCFLHVPKLHPGIFGVFLKVWHLFFISNTFMLMCHCNSIWLQSLLRVWKGLSKVWKKKIWPRWCHWGFLCLGLDAPVL